MNATSLYVSTCRVMLAATAGKEDAQDLFRLLPYLRAALSCAVCGRLVRKAATPARAVCPHAVCRGCRQGRKRLKPACSVCRDLRRYRDNCQLRILLQSYKRLCEYFSGTEAYRRLRRRGEGASAGLVELIEEGAGFSDGYESTAGLSQSAYSILPCVYANSATQTAPSASASASDGDADEPSVEEPSGPPPLYSVARAPAGNKITIKRKPPVEEEDSSLTIDEEEQTIRTDFKKPAHRSRASGGKRKGCRCGNATAAPGKLTCCGQRCPCYVESKACIECKCKGCRNPHRADGLKVRPKIIHSEPEMERKIVYEMPSVETRISHKMEISADPPEEEGSSPATDDDSGSPAARESGDAPSPPPLLRGGIFSPFMESSLHSLRIEDVDGDV